MEEEEEWDGDGKVDHAASMVICLGRFERLAVGRGVDASTPLAVTERLPSSPTTSPYWIRLFSSEEGVRQVRPVSSKDM